MNLRQLQFFLDLVEQGGFSRAASIRNVDQPFISRQIRKLEETVGAPLLYRNGRGVELTDEGLDLLNVVRPFLSNVQDVMDRVQARSVQPRGRISLGIVHHLGETLCPSLLSSFCARYPHVHVHISGGNSSIIQEWLLRARIDLGIYYDIGSSPQLVTEELIEERIVLVGPMALAREHGINGRKAISLAEAARLPLVLPSSQHGLRIRLDRLAELAGIPLQSPYEIDLYGTLRALVMAGHGFTLLPLGAMLNQVVDTQTFLAPLVDPEMTAVLSMVFACNKPTSFLTREFAGELRARIKSFSEEQARVIASFERRY